MFLTSPKYQRVRFIMWLPRSISAPPPVSSFLNHHSGTGFGIVPSALCMKGPEAMFMAWAVCMSPRAPLSSFFLRSRKVELNLKG